MSQLQQPYFEEFPDVETVYDSGIGNANVTLTRDHVTLGYKGLANTEADSSLIGKRYVNAHYPALREIYDVEREVDETTAQIKVRSIAIATPQAMSNFSQRYFGALGAAVPTFRYAVGEATDRGFTAEQLAIARSVGVRLISLDPTFLKHDVRDHGPGEMALHAEAEKALEKLAGMSLGLKAYDSQTAHKLMENLACAVDDETNFAKAFKALDPLNRGSFVLSAFAGQKGENTPGIKHRDVIPTAQSMLRSIGFSLTGTVVDWEAKHLPGYYQSVRMALSAASYRPRNKRNT